jgi:hypothetical protein
VPDKSARPWYVAVSGCRTWPGRVRCWQPTRARAERAASSSIQADCRHDRERGLTGLAPRQPEVLVDGRRVWSVSSNLTGLPVFLCRDRSCSFSGPRADLTTLFGQHQPIRLRVADFVIVFHRDRYRAQAATSGLQRTLSQLHIRRGREALGCRCDAGLRARATIQLQSSARPSSRSAPRASSAMKSAVTSMRSGGVRGDGA